MPKYPSASRVYTSANSWSTPDSVTLPVVGSLVLNVTRARSALTGSTCTSLIVGGPDASAWRAGPGEKAAAGADTRPEAASAKPWGPSASAGASTVTVYTPAAGSGTCTRSTLLSGSGRPDASSSVAP